MITAALVAAVASLPLGLWPVVVGPPATEADGVEVYLAEPEADYFILGVQALQPALVRGSEAALAPLAARAKRLGADAVLLLPELVGEELPEDPEDAPPVHERLVIAVFIAFAADAGDEPGAVRSRLAPAPAQRAPRRIITKPPAPSRMKIIDCTTMRALTTSPASAR